MEEGRGGVGESAAAKISMAFGGQRQRFQMELRPGETTIVSWKKLVKDSNNKVNKPPTPSVPVSVPVPVPVPVTEAPPPVPPPPHTVLDSRIAPGQTADDADDAPPASRFSAVIEKIERLYMGKNSSDEEDLNDVPDDDEYDTEDSFIDDTELDEYFQVDNSAIKHDGFFVNRGQLERTSNEPTVLPTQQPKKRRRKDLAKGHGGSDDGHVPNKQIKVNKKAAGKPASVVGKNSTSSLPSMVTATVNFEDGSLQNQINASEISGTKKSADAKTPMDQSPLIVSSGEAIMVGKDIDKQKTGMHQSKNHGMKLKDGSEFPAASSQRLNDKSSHAQSKSQLGRSLYSGEELHQPVQRKEKSSIRERSDVKVPENSLQNVKTPLMQRKEGSSVKSKSSMLEKAIRELEKIVAESRPPSGEVPDADNSAQAVKRRMRPEIKQKLAKVARLAQATHGKISKELLNRLMSILGHLIQLRTLKRNLKIMVNMDLSAKQEKDARFNHIKKEVDEMVKMRIPLMKAKAIEQQAGASDDFQETSTKGKEVLKRRFSMDDALEDKICDLYDLYVDGLEEDAGPHLRKLYAELAELWPKGFMDNHGIKRAIYRAKDRKKALSSRHKDQEKLKRKKLLTPKTQESIRAEASSGAQPQFVQEKLVADSASKGLTSVNRPVPSTTAADAVARMPIAHVSGPTIDRPKQEKVRGSSSNGNDVRTTEVVVKKKAKRKPESELGETHTRLEKLTLPLGEERQKSNKQVTSPLQKPIPQPAAPVIPNLNHAAEMSD